MIGQVNSKNLYGSANNKDSKYNPDYKRTNWVTFGPEIKMHYNAKVGKLRCGVC